MSNRKLEQIRDRRWGKTPESRQKKFLQLYRPSKSQDARKGGTAKN